MLTIILTFGSEGKEQFSYGFLFFLFVKVEKLILTFVGGMNVPRLGTIFLHKK